MTAAEAAVHRKGLAFLLAVLDGDAGAAQRREIVADAGDFEVLVELLVHAVHAAASALVAADRAVPGVLNRVLTGQVAEVPTD